MKLNRGIKTAGVAMLALALVTTGVSPASAKSASRSISLPGSNTLTAYAYIQDWADASGCGAFRTKASSAKTLAAITNSVQWDPIGVGVSASIKGTGVSVSGNNTGAPTASITARYATSTGISGTACMSWGTFYLGVFSTASSRVSNTFYSTTVHL